MWTLSGIGCHMPSSQSIELVKYSAPVDVQVLRFDDLRARAIAGRWRHTPHRVDFCHLIAVTEGDLSHLVDFVPIRCGVGSLLLVKPGQVHSFDFNSAWDGWLVVFKPEVIPASHGLRLNTNINDVFESLPTLIEPPADEQEAALAIISQMLRDTGKYKDQAAGNLLMRTALLYLLLRLQLFASSSVNPEDVIGKAASNRFFLFKKLVEDCLRTQQHIHQYAMKLGCSEKSLNRSVFAVTGVTAKTYLTQRIVLEAKRLLVHSTQPIGAIGIDLGFDEPTNFVKYFKRESGMLPMAFRQLYVKQSS
jgi:AraC-like DNA-binding protein